MCDPQWVSKPSALRPDHLNARPTLLKCWLKDPTHRPPLLPLTFSLVSLLMHPPLPLLVLSCLTLPISLVCLSLSLPSAPLCPPPPWGGTTNYDKMNRDSLDICWRVDSIEGIQSVWKYKESSRMTNWGGQGLGEDESSSKQKCMLPSNLCNILTNTVNANNIGVP